MARIDKYEPVAGGFRGILLADYAGSANPIGVGLDATGKVTIGVSVAAVGIIGVICVPGAKKAGDPVDVMQEGELVNFGGAAGTVYTALTTTGAIAAVAADATHIRVGFTAEADRLIVRVAQ
jgi:hypothetical protein